MNRQFQEIPDYSPVTNMASPLKRMLWASINSRLDASLKKFREFNDKILVSWRMFLLMMLLQHLICIVPVVILWK